jgi:putative thioredoxin
MDSGPGRSEWHCASTRDSRTSLFRGNTRNPIHVKFFGGGESIYEMGTGYEINDFQNDVLERSRTVPVVVDFWAEWCGPCKTLGPILEKLAAKSAGRWELAKVDTDAHQEIAAQFGIRGIPNVKLFSDAKVLDEFTGALPEHAIVRWLEQALPRMHQKEISRAQDLILKDELVKAMTILESVLRHDPDNPHARVLLARIYLDSNPEKALMLVEGIEEHSEFYPMADAVRTIGMLLRKLSEPFLLEENVVKATYLEATAALARNDFDGALEKYIEVLRANRYYDDDGSRKACVAIFRVLGDDHPATQKHRRAFSSALY